MAQKKRTLEEKIAIMKAISNGSDAYAQVVDKYVKVKDPAFNWGTTDYKAVTNVAPLIKNSVDTTINYTELLQKLKYYERGKNLQDSQKYTESILDETNTKISSTIDDSNWALDLSDIDVSTVGETSFYQRLLQDTNDALTAQQYFEEFKEEIKPYLVKSLKENLKNLVSSEINTKIDSLPTDYDSYEHDAPTEEQIKTTVETLSNKLSEVYPNLEDNAVVEYIDDTLPIGIRLRKDLTNGSTLTVYYYLERAVSGENEESYSKAYDDTEDVKYSVVTLSELNNKESEILSKAYEADSKILSEAKSYTDTSTNNLYKKITDELSGSTDSKISAYKDEIISTATTTAESVAKATAIKFNDYIEILKKVYPVGCLYWTSSKEDPEKTFGFGTWKQIKDTFVLAAGDKYTVDSTGGNNSIYLTENQLPPHTHTAVTTITDPGHSHTITSHNDDYNGSNVDGQTPGGISKDAYESANTPTTLVVSTSKTGITATTEIKKSGGSSASINIMPPYIVKYCWERVEDVVEK